MKNDGSDYELVPGATILSKTLATLLLLCKKCHLLPVEFS